MINISKSKLLALIIICLSVTVGWESYVLAVPAPGRSAIITPGTGSPCDIRIYIDSGQYGAANCRTGDNYGFNTVPDFGATINLLAIPNCPAGGCRIYIETGSYQITTQINTLVTGDEIAGASRDGVIINAPTPAGGAGTIWITNKDQVSGDKGIILHDFTFNGGVPTIVGASYINYDNAIWMKGAYQSHFYNLHLIYSGARHDFFIGATSAQIQTTAGLNYQNHWDHIFAEKGVGSNTFNGCNDCTVSYSDFLQWGDDAFLVVGWARGTVFDGDLFDGTGNPNPTKGSSTGQLYALNDGSVVSNTNTTAVDVSVQNCHFVNNVQGAGQRAGLAASAGSTLHVGGTIVERQPGVSGALTAQGGGIVINGVLKMFGTMSRFNQGNGITLTPIQTGKVEDDAIVGVRLYDNGLGGGGGTTAGVAIRATGTTLSQRVIITNSIFYDDQGVATQTFGIDQPSAPGTPSRLLSALGNDFTNQPTNTINVGCVSCWYMIADNINYNPQAQSSVTAGVSPFTTVLAPFKQQIEITTLAGMTGWTCKGQTMINAVNQISPVLLPGDTCILTWATTAPVYRILPE